VPIASASGRPCRHRPPDCGLSALLASHCGGTL
jgi:hypothetical protein